MMRKGGWTKREERILRTWWDRLPLSELAARLSGRSVVAIKAKASKLGICADRRWEPSELRFLDKHYRARGGKWCAERLGRSICGVYQAADKLGLMTRRDKQDKERVRQAIGRWHPKGYSDGEIADKAGASRKWVNEVRREMGLPSNAWNGRHRKRVAIKTAEQVKQAGVKSLADVRVLSFQKYAEASGWPSDIRPRAVQILNALYNRGPMTRREICKAIGLPWIGSRKSLGSSDKPGGSYLAALARRGLVQVLARARKIKGGGKGSSCHVYAIPISIHRGRPETWPSDGRY